MQLNIFNEFIFWNTANKKLHLCFLSIFHSWKQIFIPPKEKKPHLASPLLSVDDNNGALNVQRIGHELALLLESYRIGRVTEEHIDRRWTQLKDVALFGRK